ncbi:monovalent cation/H(+) antiporter subunit G [Pontibacter populi]|uniref:Monovalent cation/H(+) antiporter subunit G n=1 Tax=Pontibacter populi TaxID=890055 RepID=A0ABV1RYJ5_9BACT
MVHQLHEIISSILILAGVVFMLLSAIGLLRFPDFYTRMSTITKGSTLGLGLILIGLSVYFNKADVLLKVLLILFFIFITSPVAAHVISRTAVKTRIPFWKRTNLHEFKDYMEREDLQDLEDKSKDSIVD